MSSSLMWGFLAASSLILGGLLSSWLKIKSHLLGLIMAFGSGVLISAVAFELVHDALERSGESVHTAYGLLAGALTFFIGNFFIGKMGGHVRKKRLSLIYSVHPDIRLRGDPGHAGRYHDAGSF